MLTSCRATEFGLCFDHFLAEILQPVLCRVLNEPLLCVRLLESCHPLSAVLVAVVVADDAAESAIRFLDKAKIISRRADILAPHDDVGLLRSDIPMVADQIDRFLVHFDFSIALLVQRGYKTIAVVVGRFLSIVLRLIVRPLLRTTDSGMQFRHLMASCLFIHRPSNTTPAVGVVSTIHGPRHVRHHAALALSSCTKYRIALKAIRDQNAAGRTRLALRVIVSPSSRNISDSGARKNTISPDSSIVTVTTLRSVLGNGFMCTIFSPFFSSPSKVFQKRTIHSRPETLRRYSVFGGCASTAPPLLCWYP